MKTVLVTGAAGLVGSWVVRLAPAGVDVRPTTRDEVDLADGGTLLELVSAVEPSVVVHTAYRATEPELDIVVASRNVVDACVASGAGLVHLSTDLVFDGSDGPYGEHDRTEPCTAYGHAKAAVEADIAERLPDAAIIRTSLVCWHDPPDPRSQAIIDGLRSGPAPRLFVDELRCPVRVDDLAAAIWEIVALPPRSRGGIWHVVGPEALSRYALGVLVAAWAGLDPDGIAPAWAADHPEPRPRDTRLTTRATDVVLRQRPRPVSTLFARWPAPRRGRNG